MKNTLALIGTSALLASCGGLVTVGPDPVEEANIVATSLDVTGNLLLQQSYQDPDTLRTYAQGDPVICTNLTTTLAYNFTYTGQLDVYSVALVDRDVNPNVVTDLRVFEELNDDGVVVNTSYQVTSGTGTLGSITKQAIVVVPTEPEVLGDVQLRVQAFTDAQDPVPADTVYSQRILVLGNCPQPQ